MKSSQAFLRSRGQNEGVEPRCGEVCLSVVFGAVLGCCLVLCFVCTAQAVSVYVFVSIYIHYILYIIYIILCINHSFEQA